MGVFNVWNHEEIDNLLSGLAEGDEVISRYLKRYIRPQLLRHGPAMEELAELPQNSPGWLRAKWSGGQGNRFYTFSAGNDPGLENRLIHIRDWIRAGRNNGEEWLKRHDPDAPLPSLRREGTIDHAYDIAEEYFSGLRNEFNSQAIGDDGPGDIRDEMTFGDGWKVVRLLTPEALDRESAHMQHCIGEGSYDQHLDGDSHVFYSLRDPKNRPHATMEVVNEDGIAKLIQCKGKQNAILLERYFDYTVPFVRDRGLEPPIRPDEAGIIKHEGEYYTMYRLPEDYFVPGDLDLGALHPAPVLPGGLRIEGDLRLDAEAASQIPEDCEIGRNVVFCWKKGNNYHRDGGPAIIGRDAQTGVVTRESWRKEDKLHREDGPAAIWRDPQTGVVTWEEWYKEGERHCEDGPADTRRDAQTGVVTGKVWYKEGKRHREDGPAIIRLDAQTGVVTEKMWYKEGKLHREDGPADIERDPQTGVVTYEAWYLNGDQVTPEQAGDYSFRSEPALEAV